MNDVVDGFFQLIRIRGKMHVCLRRGVRKWNRSSPCICRGVLILWIFIYLSAVTLFACFALLSILTETTSRQRWIYAGLSMLIFMGLSICSHPYMFRLASSSSRKHQSPAMETPLVGVRLRILDTARSYRRGVCCNMVGFLRVNWDPVFASRQRRSRSFKHIGQTTSALLRRVSR
jgi:hypothetical protein